MKLAITGFTVPAAGGLLYCLFDLFNRNVAGGVAVLLAILLLGICVRMTRESI